MKFSIISILFLFLLGNKVQGQSIEYKKAGSYKFYSSDKRISYNRIANLLLYDEEATKKLIPAIRTYRLSNVVFGVGFTYTFIGIIFAIESGKIDPVRTGIGAGTILLGIIGKRNANNNIKGAVDIYNNNLNHIGNTTNSYQFEFLVSSNGVGLAMCF